MNFNLLTVLIFCIALAGCRQDKNQEITVVEDNLVVSDTKVDDVDLLTNKYWYSPTNFVNVPQWRYFNSEGMYKGWIEGKGEPARMTGKYKIVNNGKSMEIYNMHEDHGTETYDILTLTKDSLEVAPQGANDMSITFIYVK